jgi:hypothetical protein
MSAFEEPKSVELESYESFGNDAIPPPFDEMEPIVEKTLRAKAWDIL